MKTQYRPGQVLIVTGRIKTQGDYVTYLRPSINQKVWVKDQYNKEMVLLASHLTPVEPYKATINYKPPIEAQLKEQQCHKTIQPVSTM